MLDRPAGLFVSAWLGERQQDLSDAQIADRFVAQLERHRRLGQPERTGYSGRQIAGMADHLFMGFETDCERLRILGEKRAERILVALPAMGELPILQCTQSERQPGCLRENALVIAEQFRAPQGVNQFRFARARVSMSVVSVMAGKTSALPWTVASFSGKLANRQGGRRRGGLAKGTGAVPSVF